jgi:hypothetical protein
MSSETPKYWSCDADGESLSCTTKDEAVEAYLDEYGRDWCARLPCFERGTLTVYGYAEDELDREKIGRWTGEGGPLSRLLEILDEDYGSPEEATEPTTPMEAAERNLIAVVLREYDVWRCHKVCTEEVDVAAWIAEHRPDWKVA